MECDKTAIDSIYQRRSTRNFDPKYKISKSEQREILNAGLRAPSPKNRQPWQYVIVDDRETLGKIRGVMENTLLRLKAERLSQHKDISDLNMAMDTAKIIGQCSMLVFVCYERDDGNEHGEKIDWPLSAQAFEVADIQSIGASVQNMLLVACTLGIDSLWIADVLYAHDELCTMMGLRYPFIAAVAFGLAAKHQTPRKSLEEKVIYYSERNEKP